MIQDKNSRRVIVLLVSVALAFSLAQADTPVATASGTTVANGFNVLTVSWGTSTTPASPGPGSQDVPLTVTLQYYFANTATAIQLSLTLPSGFTDASGNPVATAYVTGSVTTGSTVTAVFYLNISPAVSAGTYSFPLAINWGVQVSPQQSVALVQYTSATVSLKGKVQLSFQALQTSLLAGQVNSIGLIISNIGSGPATQITTAVSAPASVSVLTQIPVLASLAPNSNTSTTVKIFVSSSTAGSAIAIAFTASYTDAYANAGTTTQTLGFYALPAATLVEPVLTFATSDSPLTPGKVNAVAITLTNTGPGPASSVRTTVSASAGFSVLSQFPQVASLQAGGSVNASLNVFVPTSAAGGAITLTLTATFTDTNGNSQSNTQTLGFYALPAATLVEPVLTFSSQVSSLTPGKINNVAITLTNTGPGPASSVRATVSAPSGFSVLSQFPQVASLQAGGSVSASLLLFVPVSAAGNAATLTLTATFTDTNGNSQSSTQNLGFYAATVTEPILTFTTTGGPLMPGQVNDILVSLTNYGPGAATAVRATVSAPSGFSVLSQFPQVASLQAGQSVNVTLQIFAPVSSSASAVTLTFGVTFTDPYGNQQSSNQALGLYALSSVTISNAISLSVATSSNSLTSGVESTVRFVVQNTGQVSIFSPTISLTTSSPLVVTANSTMMLAGAVVKPGSSITYTAKVEAGTSAAEGLYSGILTVAFTDQLGEGHSQAFPVAFAVSVPVFQVSASTISSQINIGKSSTVAFFISNSGTAPVYSPTFSLTAPSGFAVISNSSVSMSGFVLSPGQRVKYSTNMTSGPKTAEGAYVGTLTVVYLDQFGNAHSSTFSIGLVAVGVIQMVLQNYRVTGNGTIYSLSGTLLNEGAANAYYTQVTATITAGTRQLATASTYVGEVDVNTPLPVSLTIIVPGSALASANGTGTLTFVASYQNDFGQPLQYKTSQRLALPSGSSAGGGFTGTFGGGNSGTNTTGQQTVSASTVDMIRYGALVGIVAAAILTLAFVRRGRSRGGRRVLRKPEVY